MPLRTSSSSDPARALKPDELSDGQSTDNDSGVSTATPPLTINPPSMTFRGIANPRVLIFSARVYV